MTEAFNITLQERLESLCESELFLHQPTGSLVKPNVIRTQLSDKPGGYQEGSEYPLVRWAVFSGKQGKQGISQMAVVVEAAIWTSGNEQEGSNDIERLISALLGIVENRNFGEFRLVTPIDFAVGGQRDDEEGLQPHPYYQGKIYLNFITDGLGSQCG
jgi:hypothetical protein